MDVRSSSDPPLLPGNGKRLEKARFHLLLVHSLYLQQLTSQVQFRFRETLAGGFYLL